MIGSFVTLGEVTVGTRHLAVLNGRLPTERVRLDMIRMPMVPFELFRAVTFDPKLASCPISPVDCQPLRLGKDAGRVN